MRRRSQNFLRPIVSQKNFVVSNAGLSSTILDILIAKAKDAPVLASTSDVGRGSMINAIYCFIDVCGLGGTGVLNVADFYLIKNPGDNLTEPGPIGWGSSNEKKFIFKVWSFQIMRNQDGNMPFHWEGWIKVPKRYRRMGADDTIRLIATCTSGVTGHISSRFIYKWYM